MRRVQAPSGRIFEFPTETPDDQIVQFLNSLDQRTLVEERSTPRAAADIGVDFGAGVAGFVPTAVDALQLDKVAESDARRQIRENAGETAASIYDVTIPGVVERAVTRGRELIGAGAKAVSEGIDAAREQAPAAIRAGLNATGLPGAALIGENLDVVSGAVRGAGEAVIGDLDERRKAENDRRVAAGLPTLEEESQQQVTSRAANAMRDKIEQARSSLKSDYANAIDIELGKAVEGGIGNTAQFIADSPGEALSSVSGSALAYLLPGLAAGRATRALGLADEAATAVNVQSTGALAATQGAEQAADGVMQLPAEELANVPGYEEMKAKGYSDEQIRLVTAAKAYDGALGTGLATSAATGAATQALGLAPVEQILARGGRVGQGRLAGAVSGAVREAPGEFIQGGGEALAQNLGEVVAGTRDRSEAFEGVGASGLLEAFAGAGMGAATGAIAPQKVAEAVTSQPNEADPVAQAQRDVAAIYAAAKVPTAEPGAEPGLPAAPEPMAPPAPQAAPAPAQTAPSAPAATAPAAQPADELEARLFEAGAAPVVRPGLTPEDQLAAQRLAEQQAAQTPPPSAARGGETPVQDPGAAAGPQSRPRDLPRVRPAGPAMRVRTPMPEAAGRGARLQPIPPAAPVQPPAVPVPPEVEAAVQQAPDRISFRDNDVVARAKLERTFLEFGIDPVLANTLAQSERVPTGAIRDSVTGGFDGRADGVKAETIQRAVDHVDQTGEDAFFVSADISNLGGLNKFHNDVADEANRDFRGLTDVMLEELRATGADVVPMRTGGDEIGYVVVNASQEAVNTAIERAKVRALEYARARGFDQIPHTKASRTDRGVTFHAGTARIMPDMSVEEIAREADLGVNASKNAASPRKDGESEREEATGSARDGAPDGQAGRAAGRDGAAAGRTEGEVRPAVGRAEGEGRAAPQDAAPGVTPEPDQPAAPRGAIDSVIQRTLAAMGLQGDAVTVLDSPKDLPRGVSRGGLDGRTEGIYDPSTGRVFLFRGALTSPARAVWVALHELAGHKGLRALLPPEEFAKTLDAAGTNAMVRGIARAIEAEARADAEAGAEGARPMEPAVFLEEALAEITAAYFTGDMDALIDRYGAGIDAEVRDRSEREKAQSLAKRIIASIKRRLFNSGAPMSDAEVVGLISNAYKSLRAGAAPQSVDAAPAMQSRVPLSSRWMFDNFDRAKRMLGLGSGNNLARRVGEALDAYVASKSGRIDPADRSDESRNKIAAAMADEIMLQVGDTGQATGSGVGWYSVNFPNAVRRLSSRFPELDNDAEAAARGMVDAESARNLFTMILAVTSNGEKVRQNLKMAVEMFGAYRDGASLSESMPGTRRADALENNVAVIESLIQRFGVDGIRGHLLSEMTVKEINAERRKAGEKPSSDYTADTRLPRSALYFGAKLGAFYANLAGSTGYLTMDLWWSRSFNRYRANMLPAPTESGMAALRQLLGLPDTASIDQLIEAARPHWKAYKDRGYKDGTEIEKKANTFIKAALLELNEAPASATERKFMFDTAIEAQRRLRRRGVQLSIADIQAALWYHEKRLYDGLGVRGRDDIGYEEAINEWAQGDRSDGPAAPVARGDAGDAAPEGEGGQAGVDVRRRAGRGLARAGRDAAGQDAGAEPRTSLQSRLPGAPVVRGFDGPDPRLVAVAEQYARDNGIQLRRQAEYVKVDPERAKRIADAYEAMEHAPNDPRVRASYDDLIRQTTAQYRALERAGYRFWFIDIASEDGQAYASSPWNAMRDIRANQSMGVFPTEEGFGTDVAGFDPAGNPLLRDTGIRWPFGGPDGELKPVLANDLFRAVHDAFGHGLEGAGFRADGEENAWQAHVRLFTGAAVGAITSETRGQNSALNFSSRPLYTVIGEQRARELYGRARWAKSQDASGRGGRGVQDGAGVPGVRTLEWDDGQMLQPEVRELQALRGEGSDGRAGAADASGFRGRGWDATNAAAPDRQGGQQPGVRTGESSVGPAARELGQPQVFADSGTRRPQDDAERMGRGAGDFGAGSMAPSGQAWLAGRRGAQDADVREQAAVWKTITVGEHNRTATAENTVFADQKTGLMPEWTWLEGRAGDMGDRNEADQAAGAGPDGQPGVRRDDAREAAAGLLQSRSFPADAPAFRQRKQQADAVSAQAIHYSGSPNLAALDGKFAGAGSAGAERRRFGMGQYGAGADPGDTARRLYFYVQEGDTPPRKEDVVAGSNRYAVNLTNLYDADTDPRGLREDAGANVDYFEELVNDAGFDGYIKGGLSGIDGRIAILHGLKKRVPVVSAPMQSRAPQTREFREWFAGSKVVDANGEPLVVYHGTLKSFSRFDINAERNMAAFRDAQGFYFTRYPGDASAYIEDSETGEPAEGSNVMPVYLSMKNPLRVAAEDVDNHPAYISEARRARMEAQGYDGIIYADGVEYVVFDSSQIKSIFNDRPTSSPDIMQSRAAREARATAAQLRQRKSQLARELTTNMLTAEQVKSWTNRARLLIGEVAVSPDFAQELADAKRALGPERRAALAGDRKALAEYDNIRDMIGVIDEGMRNAREKQAVANRLLDKVERRTSTMSLAEREALVEQLAVALDSAEMAYVAAKRIADWRSKNDFKIVKAQRKRTETLDYLASEGFQQGSFLWQSGDLKEKAASVKRKFRRALQDRMIDMRDVQEQIERELGITLDDMQNVYRQENLMHGRVADAIDGFRQRLVDPLKRAIKDSGIPMATVEEYLWARHAEERNAKIRSIRPGVDDGSGMTDQQARDILARFTPEQNAKLARISRLVDGIRRNTLETMVASGQLDREGADRILASYKHYVPLRGKDGEGEERVGGGTGTGQGISAGRSGVQRALGRKTPPKNILAELVGDSERAIVQAGKAEVGRSLLRLALSYPNKDLWEVEPVELRPKFNESTGEVYLEIVNDDSSSVIVKHNGRPYKVAIKHPRLVAALRNTGTEGMQWIVQYFGALNRWLSAVFTRFNPGFVPVNMARDILQGVTGIAAELGTASAAKVAGYYPGAGWASLKDAREQRGDASVADDRKSMEDWAREFAESGGKTGYTAIDDADTMQRDIENSMLNIWEVAKRNKGDVFNTIGTAFERIPGIKAIEDVNEAVENALRLATYTHLRKDKGWTRQRAAEYAKEMTVNFNRKGTVGSVVNALYLFFNAAVQGSRRTIKLMKHPKVQVVLGSLMAGQWLLATSLGMATFGDDDETLWEKIPDHVKRRSFVIPLGFEDNGTARYISIPMPFGFNIFPSAGGYFANYSSPHWRGRMGDDVGKHFVEAFAYTSSTAIDALSPVPIGEEGFMYPTLVGIGVDLARNRDDLDRRIRPSDEFSQFEAPRAGMANPGTATPFLFAAKALNRLGGGDDYNAPKIMPGLLDVSPNELEYLFNTFTGGPGTTLTQGWRAAAREVAVGDMASFDIPVARAVSGGVRPEQREAARFYDNKDRIERNLERLRDAYADGGVEAYKAMQLELGPAYYDIQLRVRKEDSETGPGKAGEVMVNEDGRPQFVAPEGSLLGAYREAKRDLTSINREIRRVFNDRTLGPVERQRRLVELQREREVELRSFNRQQSAYDAAAGSE